MANNKNTVVIYGDYFNTLKDYDLEILGAIFYKILYYAEYKESYEFENENPYVTATFKMIRHFIDIDFKKYQEKCEQNRNNVLKRYRQDKITEWAKEGFN